VNYGSGIFWSSAGGCTATGGVSSDFGKKLVAPSISPIAASQLPTIGAAILNHDSGIALLIANATAVSQTQLTKEPTARTEQESSAASEAFVIARAVGAVLLDTYGASATLVVLFTIAILTVAAAV